MGRSKHPKQVEKVCIGIEVVRSLVCKSRTRASFSLLIQAVPGYLLGLNHLVMISILPNYWSGLQVTTHTKRFSFSITKRIENSTSDVRWLKEHGRT